MDQYAVFGNPIKHSLSPKIHSIFAKQTGHKISYNTVLVADKLFASIAANFARAGGDGINITVPFKEDAYKLCNSLSTSAKAAKAVNTIKIENGLLYGDNTDGQGLINDLNIKGVELKGKKVLIIGAGGATRGMILPLVNEKIASLTICNRTISKAEDIASSFDFPIQIKALSEINSAYDIVIHATSTGLHGEIPKISSKIFKSNTVCYDIVYNDTITPFNYWAKEQGALVIYDGFGMLIEQAALAFLLWRGVLPITKGITLNSLVP